MVAHPLKAAARANTVIALSFAKELLFIVFIGLIHKAFFAVRQVSGLAKAHSPASARLFYYPRHVIVRA